VKFQDFFISPMIEVYRNLEIVQSGPAFGEKQVRNLERDALEPGPNGNAAPDYIPHIKVQAISNPMMMEAALAYGATPAGFVSAEIFFLVKSLINVPLRSENCRSRLKEWPRETEPPTA
jgi:hypothetical protein